MNNKIDKLFRHTLARHHLPNDGPQWAGLERRMKGPSNKLYLLYLGIGIIFLGLGFFLVQQNLQSPGNANQVAQGPVPTNQSKIDDINTSTTAPVQGSPEGASEQKINSGASNPVQPISDEGTNNDATNPSNIPNSKKHEEASVESGDKESEAVQVIDKSETKAQVNDDNVPAPEENHPVVKADADSTKDSNTNPVNQAPASKGNPTPALAIRPKFSLFAVYLNISPSLASSKNTPVTDSTTHRSYSDLRSKGERIKSSLGFDFGIRFKPFRKISISTGFIFEERIEKVEYHYQINEIPFIDSATGEIILYIKPAPAAVEKVDYSGQNIYRYIGVPLKINFEFLDLGKFNLGVNVSGTYLRQSSLKGKTIDHTWLELADLSSKNSSQLKNIFNSGLGLDFNYRLMHNMMLSISPGYSVQLNKNALSTRAKQASLNFNLQYFIF